MTNQWIGWNGGECPVEPRTTVAYVMANGQECVDRAMDLDWGLVNPPDDWIIVKYRVVKEYREPREVWMKEWRMVTFNSAGSFLEGDPSTEHTEWGMCSPECEGATLFREVIE